MTAAPAVPDLSSAHRANRVLTHRAGANFSVGFRFLPKERRQAVYAAYAWCRAADDAVDEGDPAGAPARLDAWARELDAVYGGSPSSPSGVALAEALPRFPIPKSAFEGLLAGCRQDLVRTRYETFEELLGYCDLVASTISTISLGIFGGLGDARAEARGRELATALQLTNIVRDVGEDVARGRVYLPLEDLERFGAKAEDLLALRPTPALADVVRWEAGRALSYFHAAEPVKDLVDRECRFAVTMMGGIYAEVAREVLARPLETLQRRIALSTPRKVRAVLVRLLDRRFDRISD
ncbi:MAG: phytoene/squalene synthase family protein [Holophagales bacterium]|nr:phytoene/squalene synthase family protein [Holophagales bacterium]